MLSEMTNETITRHKNLNIVNAIWHVRKKKNDDMITQLINYFFSIFFLNIDETQQ